MSGSHSNISPAIRELLLGDLPEDAPPNPCANGCDPIDRYTNTIMPTVQLYRPLSLFDHIDIPTLTIWWGYDEGKLLVIPFDGEVNKPKLHANIMGRILAAVNEITLLTTACIVAPPSHG